MTIKSNRGLGGAKCSANSWSTFLITPPAFDGATNHHTTVAWLIGAVVQCTEETLHKWSEVGATYTFYDGIGHMANKQSEAREDIDC